MAEGTGAWNYLSPVFLPLQPQRLLTGSWLWLPEFRCLSLDHERCDCLVAYVPAGHGYFMCKVSLLSVRFS